MTAKFKQIIERLRALVTFRNVKAMTDDDFIANIDAANLLINTYDDLGLDRDRDGIRRRMSVLYSEMIRRINTKGNIRLAMPLIKALYRFIFDRKDDFGPAKWRDTLNEMCCKVVEEYRNSPLIDSYDYLFALDVVCSIEDASFNPGHSGAEPFSAKATPLLQEYQEAISALLEDIDNLPLAERIKRVRAYERAKLTFTPDNWEEWAIARETLKSENLSGLDDSTLILWWEITDEPPMKELKRRAGNSKQVAVEYLQAQIFTEFTKESRQKAKRKLTRDLKTLNDDIIGDIIPVKITADMSVATLYALEIIFYLRLQLAQIGWEDKEFIYEELCIDRFQQIAKALTKKYKTAQTLNEKIEILERLSAIGQLIHSDDLKFAIEEADKLLRHPCRSLESGTDPKLLRHPCRSRAEERAVLTYSQRLRLEWIPNINSENESQIVTELLNSITIPNSSFLIPNSESSSLLIPNLNDAVFDMATIAIISDLVTTKERDSIFNRFIELVNAAIASNDTENLSRLLATGAYWNSSPRFREKIKDLTAHLPIPNSSFLIPNSVNPIAAEIYSRIDKINGKYTPQDIPA